MRLNFHDQVPLVVEFNDPSIVVEDGEQPIDLLANLLGGTDDIALEETADGRVASGLIVVVDRTVKNFVFAVLRPGLCQHFQFYVSGIAPQPIHLPLCCGGTESRRAWPASRPG